MKGVWIWVIAFALICTDLQAMRIRKISSQDGLSNNAIFSMYQNSLGELYIGTLDGLNIWDGQNMRCFTAADGKKYFVGNKIKHILPSGDEHIYLLTMYGLAKLNMNTKEVIFYDDFAYHAMIGLTKDGNIFSINENRQLEYFDHRTEKSHIVSGFDLDRSSHCLRMTISDNGTLYIFTDRDSYKVHLTTDETRTEIREVHKLPLNIRYISQPHCETPVYIITDDGRLGTFSPTDGSIDMLARFDFPQNYRTADDIKGIIGIENGWYVCFWDNLYFLKKNTTKLEKTDFNYHLFTIIKDKNQPILWGGSDGNGLIKYTIDDSPLKCVTFDQLPYDISMPIRCFHKDGKGNLWVGTKGNGLLCLERFSPDRKIDRRNTGLFTTSNSRLSDDRVYCMTESRHKGFYIGTEGSGLNWCSYRDDKISMVKGSSKIRRIHSVMEDGDSTLWITNGKSQIYKCHTAVSGDSPVIDRIDTLDLLSSFGNTAAIYPIAKQNDTILWIGTKGHGTLCHNLTTRDSRMIQFPIEFGYARNEITHINNDKDILFATKNGLVIYNSVTDSSFLSRHTSDCSAKASLIDSEGNIWVSSNSGIVVLDSCYNHLKTYDLHSDLSVTEYSDAACYKDAGNGDMYFGGINGFCIISGQNSANAASYTPDITITHIIDGSKSEHISQCMRRGKLSVPYTTDTYSIRFSAIDHLNHANRKFVWSIDGYDDVERPCEGFQLYLPSLEPGNYRLRIRYEDNPDICCYLSIRIIPPFYRSTYAYALYTLLIALCIYMIVRRVNQRYTAMKQKLHTEYAEEIKQIKQETQKNITDRLSIQISFILGLCQQIRSFSKNTPILSDKVNMVEYNIAKINNSLHLLDSFKNISENADDDTSANIVMVSTLSLELLQMAESSKEFKGISLTYDIKSDIIAIISRDTYLALFKTLLNITKSLLSDGKHIHIALSHSDMIAISVTADSKQETYDNFKSGRNKIAAFENMLAQIGAEASHDFNDGKVNLRITFPDTPANIALETDEESPASDTIYSAAKESLHIISRKKEITSFLSYFMSEKYDIRVFEDINSALSQDSSPVAIIYDITSMMKHFSAFISKSRDSKSMRQIPIIAISSAFQTAEREECIRNGIDACLSFPFGIETLYSTVEELQKKRENLAEYYKLPASSFTFNQGQLIHDEDRMLMKKIMRVIDMGLADPGLSAPIIAEKLGISTRVLYRKLSTITDKPLKQIITDIRIKSAVSLLGSSKLSIEEIMYRVGYDNAPSFYRNFKSHNGGLTPKEYRDKVMKEVKGHKNS